VSNAGWWQTLLWQYAAFAVVIYGRAAAERRTVPVEIARRVSTRHGLGLTASPLVFAGKVPQRAYDG
jgi:hypothetical protein